MDLKIYKNIVSKNINYFKSLDKQLKEITKEITKVSKEQNNNRVLECYTTYGDFNLADKVYYKILSSVPTSVNKEAVVWYISFCTNLTKKLNKDSFYKLKTNLIKKYTSSNNYSTAIGFAFDWVYANKGAQQLIEDKTSITKRYLSTFGAKEVIKDTVNKRFQLSQAFSFMVQNKELFPSSLQEEIEKAQKDDKVVIKELQNGFQFKLYKNNLPKKYNEKFIRNELKRLALSCKGYSKITKSNMLAIKAMVEKYGKDELLKTKYFSRVIYTNVIQRRGVEDFSKAEKDLVMSKDMYDVMTSSVMKIMGFGDDYEIPTK